MAAPVYSVTDYFTQFQRLLPRGRVWHRGWGTLQAQHLITLMPTWARLHGRANDVLVETFPCSVSAEMLPEWEATLGLPDCGPLGTIAQRQAAVCAKFTLRGGQSIQYLIDLAAAHGYDIHIEQFAPFRVDINRAEDPLYDSAWAFAFTVIAPSTVIFYFTVDHSTAEEPLASWGSGELECLIEAAAPAHTIPMFAYYAPVSISFMTPGTLDPLVVFTRAGTATYIDNTGVMRLASTDQPRWDYDPATHALRGLLVEDQRTNDIVNSNIANPGFISAASTDVPALFAGATVWKVTTTATGGTAGDVYGAFSGLPCPVGQSTTASVWVWIPAAYAVAGPPKLDMDDTTLGTGGSETIGLADMSKRGQWQRIVSTITIGAGGTASYNWVIRQNTPNGAGNAFYFTCPQSERNADTASSYIATGAAPGTRAQDRVGIPAGAMNGWFFPPGGTWFAEFINRDPTPGFARIVGEPTGGITPLYLHTDTRLGQYDGSFVLTTNTGAANAVHKGVSTFADGVGRICLDGGAVASGPMGAGYAALSSTGIAFLTIGAPGDTENMSGYIRAFRYQAAIMSDAEMRAITT
jgi:uncharacterized protein YmfQ (DUF2313 family)